MTSAPAVDVAGLVAELLAAHADDEPTAFLGAQFDAGLAWVHHPPGDGGLGLSPALQPVVDAALDAAGRRGDWMRNPMGVGMCGPALAVHGTPEQRRRHLRPIFDASEIWCQLFSEPGAGSDVATLATRAVRDGDVWVVNGQKVWTSLADEAAFGLLLARTEPAVPKHRGLTAFVLDMSTPGVDVRPLRQLNGEAHFSEVYLTDVAVPDRCRVGEPGDGWRVALTTLMNERVSIGGSVTPRGTGPIAVALEAWHGCGSADARRRDRLAALWIDAEVLRLGNLRAAAQRRDGVPGPVGSVGKLAGALLSQRIAAFAVEVLGAGGLLFPYDDGLSAEDATSALLMAPCATIAGGTTEVMRNILGERVLGLPPEPRADADLPWNAIPR